MRSKRFHAWLPDLHNLSEKAIQSLLRISDSGISLKNSKQVLFKFLAFDLGNQASGETNISDAINARFDFIRANECHG
jgi:hypothetical protein